MGPVSNATRQQILKKKQNCELKYVVILILKNLSHSHQSHQLSTQISIEAHSSFYKKANRPVFMQEISYDLKDRISNFKDFDMFKLVLF